MHTMYFTLVLDTPSHTHTRTDKSPLTIIALRSAAAAAALLFHAQHLVHVGQKSRLQTQLHLSWYSSNAVHVLT